MENEHIELTPTRSVQGTVRYLKRKKAPRAEFLAFADQYSRDAEATEHHLADDLAKWESGALSPANTHSVRDPRDADVAEYRARLVAQMRCNAEAFRAAAPTK